MYYASTSSFGEGGNKEIWFILKNHAILISMESNY